MLSAPLPKVPTQQPILEHWYGFVYEYRPTPPLPRVQYALASPGVVKHGNKGLPKVIENE